MTNQYRLIWPPQTHKHLLLVAFQGFSYFASLPQFLLVFLLDGLEVWKSPPPP